ncbi:hypothetical protein KL867_17745 [Ruegeria litorea]|uniref:Tail assembly chaperone n=1 Tax=Falsiruegeria litorea TaxID=1280831 RepID=A0ABS5WV22_9RHOB|nr:hypothetical protein [Falsiruegeria litorea]MBT3142916.1 hypothetical protein [Falsiruegeria litorea]
MISTVSWKVGKKTRKLKLSTRAQLRLEEEFDGQPVDQILQAFVAGSKGVKLLVAMVKACSNDGAGLDGDDDGESEAIELIDAAGGPQLVVAKLSEVVAAAFPQPDPAKDGEEAGNDAADQTA